VLRKLQLSILWQEIGVVKDTSEHQALSSHAASAPARRTMSQALSGAEDGIGSSGLRRDLALLQALASDDAQVHGGLGVVRLAEILQRNKSQVSRALRALEQVGLVERDPETREYRLGWQLYGLAARTSDARLLQCAPRAMRELVRRLGESVHLCVLQGTQVLTLLTETPGHAFRASGWVGQTIPAYCSSAGRLLLSDHSYEQLMERFSGVDFKSFGPVQLVHSIDDLCDQIQIAQQAGYALVREEFEAELVGASAPVRDFRGRVIAALNVSAPKFRLDDRLDFAGRETAAVAGQLSRQLGWASPEL
jgi:DNA-binding IclR family transcriptional regulator